MTKRYKQGHSLLQELWIIANVETPVNEEPINWEHSNPERGAGSRKAMELSKEHLFELSQGSGELAKEARQTWQLYARAQLQLGKTQHDIQHMPVHLRVLMAMQVFYKKVVVPERIAFDRELVKKNAEVVARQRIDFGLALFIMDWIHDNHDEAIVALEAFIKTVAGTTDEWLDLGRWLIQMGKQLNITRGTLTADENVMANKRGYDYIWSLGLPEHKEAASTPHGAGRDAEAKVGQSKSGDSCANTTKHESKNPKGTSP